MARVNAPLLSFDARGTIAKTQTYASWRGINYARQRVTPANPNTTAQQTTRSTFQWLNAVFKLGNATMQAPWAAAASGQPFTDRNYFIKKNLPILRPITDLVGFIGSPGSLGGLLPAATVATGGAGQIDVAMTAPTLPTGWTIAKGVLLAILVQDSHTDASYNSYTNEDAATPFDPTITGLAAGTYEWSAWFTFTRPDAKTAYGPSVGGTAVVT